MEGGDGGVPQTWSEVVVDAEHPVGLPELAGDPAAHSRNDVGGADGARRVDEVLRHLIQIEAEFGPADRVVAHPILPVEPVADASRPGKAMQPAECRQTHRSSACAPELLVHVAFLAPEPDKLRI